MIGKQLKLITDMTSKFQMGEMPWTRIIPVYVCKEIDNN